jgi:O-antigen ligase
LLPRAPPGEPAIGFVEGEDMQETRAVKINQGSLGNQKLLPGILFTIVVWIIFTTQFHLSGLLGLALAVQVTMFFAFFYRPVWALAALIVGQLTASSYMVTIGATPISIRLLWTILMLLLVIPIVRARGGLKMGKRSLLIVIPTLFFFILATIANVVNVDVSYSMQYLRIGVTSLAIVLFIPMIIKNENDLKILGGVFLFTCLASAVVSILQHYSYSSLPSLSLYANAISKGRVVGITEGPIHLAYDLSIVFMPAIALLLMKGVSGRMRKFMPVFLIVFVIGLYFSYTRSGLYSLAPALLVLVPMLMGKMKKEFFLAALVLIAGFYIYFQITGSRYSQGFGEEQSASSRLALWQASAKIAMDNPIFGIGEGRFEQVSLSYRSQVTVDSAPSAVGVLGMEQPHNDFLRVWLSFGTLALVCYLALFVGMFINFYKGYRYGVGKFTRALSMGCFAGMAAYIVNAATHNLMDSVALLWILGGLSIAVAKLSSERKLKMRTPAVN